MPNMQQQGPFAMHQHQQQRQQHMGMYPGGPEPSGSAHMMGGSSLPGADSMQRANTGGGGMYPQGSMPGSGMMGGGGSGSWLRSQGGGRQLPGPPVGEPIGLTAMWRGVLTARYGALTASCLLCQAFCVPQLLVAAVLADEQEAQPGSAHAEQAHAVSAAAAAAGGLPTLPSTASTAASGVKPLPTAMSGGGSAREVPYLDRVRGVCALLKIGDAVNLLEGKQDAMRAALAAIKNGQAFK